MKKLKIIFAALAVLAVLGFAGYHAFLYSLGIYASDPVYQTRSGALDGYDPVAYFTEGAPRRGSRELVHEWQGARWHFASAENLARFREQPERYAPQFGGYCAYAVAHAYTARVDPAAWHIEDGRLYLNFDAETRAAWLANKAAFIRDAAANWPAVIRD